MDMEKKKRTGHRGNTTAIKDHETCSGEWPLTASATVYVRFSTTSLLRWLSFLAFPACFEFD